MVQTTGLALQEIGNEEVLHNITHAAGYQSWSSPRDRCGVALFLHEDLLPFKVGILIPKGQYSGLYGRMIGVKLLIKNISYLFISVYLPTGLESKGELSEVGKIATAMYGLIHMWSKGIDQVFVMGDNNEVIEERDRMGKSARWNRYIGALTNYEFIDTYRAYDKENPGYTCCSQGDSYSRIDHILAWGITEQAIALANVLPSPVTSAHSALICSVNLRHTVPRYVYKRVILPNMKKATPTQRKAMVLRMDTQLDQQQEKIEWLMEGGPSELINPFRTVRDLSPIWSVCEGETS